MICVLLDNFTRNKEKEITGLVDLVTTQTDVPSLPVHILYFRVSVSVYKDWEPVVLLT